MKNLHAGMGIDLSVTFSLSDHTSDRDRAISSWPVRKFILTLFAQARLSDELLCYCVWKDIAIVWGLYRCMSNSFPIICHLSKPTAQEIANRNDFFSLGQNIRLTCPCNVCPLTPHFYIVKLGFTGVYIIFLVLL